MTLEPRRYGRRVPGDDDGLLLGIDIGTTRTKAVLIDAGGHTRRDSVGRTPFAATTTGIETGVDELTSVVAAVLGDLGDDRRRVAAVGIAGVAESGAPLALDGRPLGPVIAWHDQRGDETVARLEDVFGEGLGLRIGQRLRTVSSVAKLGWLVDGGIRPARWLGVPELCLHWLSGAEATEFSLAARTGCYDVGARAWIEEVVAAIGLSSAVFPPVLAAGSAMGHVSADGARRSGLAEGTPVTVAGHDHLAGAETVGGADDDAFNSVGTAETVLRRSASLPDVAGALRARLSVTVRPGGRGWIVLASGARAGLVIESVARALGHSPAELDALADAAGERPPKTTEVDLDAIVAAERADRTPPLPTGVPADVWSAVLSALAVRTADAVERQHRLMTPARRLVVFGGGSVSGPWQRAKASALALPVLRSAAPDAVARGAAVFAGVAAGWWPSTARAPAPRLESVTN